MTTTNVMTTRRQIDRLSPDRLPTLAVIAMWLAVPNPYLLGLGLFLGAYVTIRSRWALPKDPLVFFAGICLATIIACAALIGGLPPLSRAIPLLLAMIMLAFFAQAANLSSRIVFRGSLIAGFIYIAATATTIFLHNIGRDLDPFGLTSVNYDYIDSQTTAAVERFGALGLDPNLSTSILVMILAVCIATRRLDERRSYAYLTLLALTPLFVIVSASRMTLALCIGALAWLIIRKYGPKSLLLLIPIVGAASYFAISESIPALRKVAGTDVGSLQSDGLRYALWQNGIDQIFNWQLLGVGWGRADALNEFLVGRLITFHSTWLTLLIELGLIGGLIFITVLLISTKQVLLATGALGVPLVVSYLAINTYTSFLFAVGPFLLIVALAITLRATSCIDAPRPINHDPSIARSGGAK